MVKKLIDGFQTFTNSFFDEDTDFYQKLRKHGQKPDVMIIACSDSRVDPANLFGTKPGEVFVVRNVMISKRLMKQLKKKEQIL